LRGVTLGAKCGVAAELRSVPGGGRGLWRDGRGLGHRRIVGHRLRWLTATGWPAFTVEARSWAAGGTGSGPGAVVSLLRTIRPLEQASTGCAGKVKGGPDIPADHDGCSHLLRSRGCRLLAGSAPSRAGREGIMCEFWWLSPC